MSSLSTAILLATLALSSAAFASVKESTLTCRSLSGNALNSSNREEIKTVSKDSVLQFENNTMLATVQFKEGRLIQMMLESTKTHTFTQLNMERLVKKGEGEIFLQDLASDGDYMEVSCVVGAAE